MTDFAGRWAIDREVIHDNGQTMQAQGTATFTPDDGGLAYYETGQMHMDGLAPLTFERRYRFGPDLSVYFEDGRFFHHIPAGGGRAHHHCAPDDYNVTYTFTSATEWSAVWQVSGPKKGYKMTTRYTRR
ncbi:DUF6314 family protein [Nereida sp. MMG025]|uniref:DUF6314 family protein n=1 Tax=Nereida sp. MMG025 TaxID=2909981 RepID=UPI001F3C7FBE|nr:DUF6314 family protein [Nereida sp. MMG025]